MQNSHYHTLMHVEDTHWWFVSKRDLIKKYIFKKNNLLLDVGAGTGYFVRSLNAEGVKAVGIEPSPVGLKYALKFKTPIKSGRSEKLPWKSNTFDTVTCVDVLYHKKVDVSQSLSEMFRVLKPGGTLIVFDCAYNWLQGPHDRIVSARERFTKGQLSKYVSDAGLKVKYSSYVFFALFPIVCILRLLERVFGHTTPITAPHKIINGGLIRLMKIETSLMEYISWPWGSSIIIVAKK